MIDDKDISALFDRMHSMYGDRMASPEHEPKVFQHQIKTAAWTLGLYPVKKKPEPAVEYFVFNTANNQYS